MGHLFTVSSQKRTKVSFPRKRLVNDKKKKSADALKNSRQKIRTSRIPPLSYEMVKKFEC